MARDHAPRAPTSRESITEIARRYHACLVALAQTLGLPVQDVLTQHRESVTAIFIECCRRDIRLPASVQLLPLGPDAPPAAEAPPPEASPAEEPSADTPSNGQGASTEPWPLLIPMDAGLPCQGQGIRALRPGQLRMLINRVEQLAATKGGRWPMLLTALKAEHARRRRT